MTATDSQPARGRAAYELARARLAEGAALREAAAQSGLSLRKVYEFALRESLLSHPRRPPLSARERRNIERLHRRGNLTQRAIARTVRRSVNTVNRMVRRRDRLSEGDVRFVRLRAKRSCPTCGKPTQTWPCVICTAKGRRRR